MNEHKYITEINDENFQEAVADGVKLVDFWAAWCMPCRMQTPILEKIGEEYQGLAEIMALNVDENPEIAQDKGITGIPALHLYKDGTLVQQFVGVQPPEVLKEALDTQLAQVNA